MSAEWPGQRLCSPDEAAALVAYLRTTHVPGYADDLARGLKVAWRATVAGRDELGSLLSIFGVLGEIYAADRGRPKFLVRELFEVLHRPECTDARSRQGLDALIAAERRGELRDRRITVLATTHGPVVVDGNKRSAAIYETAGQEPSLTLPVFWLTPARGLALGPPP